MGNTKEETNQKPTWFQYLKTALTGTAIGGVFGYALQRSHVYLPMVIRGQMNFSNFTMLKMFMTASLTSSLGITLLHSTRMIELEHLPVMWKRNLLGGLIMGVGIYATGACPGTVLAQVGSGVTTSYYVLLGGLIGSSLYGYLDKWVQKRFPTSHKEKNALHQRLSIPLYKLTVPFSIALVGVLYAIEKQFPWTADSGVSSSIGILDSLSTRVWSPYAAGLVIGSLQMPSYLFGGSGLGTSSAYVAVSSRLCNLFGSCNIEYFKKFQQGLKQVVFSPMLNLGIILGSYYSSLSSPYVHESLGNHHALHYVASGMVLLLGARLANGCTSGQGLTGMAKMEIGSFISVAALFGGGILASALSSHFW